MNDKAFLRYALEQSFIFPQADVAEGIVLSRGEGKSAGYTFADYKRPHIVPYYLPFSVTRKYAKSATHDIIRCPRLYAEYDMFKHDLSENIIMPADFAELRKAEKVLDLNSVSRQAAQRKKVTATIFPSAFTEQYKNICSQYAADMHTAEEVYKQNPIAVNIALLNDFADVFQKFMKRARWPHLGLKRNRKQVLYYLNEAAQLLKTHQILAQDFCATHEFYGEDKRHFYKSARYCRDVFENLIKIMCQLPDESQLFVIIQELLISPQKFYNALKAYREEHKCDNAAKIAELRRKEQKLFRYFAMLQYLNGVRAAFENRFLDECPQKRPPALPTVSPEEELKKISKIVAESKTVDTSAGKLAAMYMTALKNYDSVHKEFLKTL